jgi:hydrogenase/urease accessory protein HupE
MLDGDAARPAPDGRAIALAAVAGIATGIAGGIVWGLIVKLSEYEIGIVAWGIGFVVGTAVLLAAGRRKGLPLQVVAVVGALVGILVGSTWRTPW